MIEPWVEAIIPEISIEDMPESYQDVAITIGVEAAVKLAAKHGGIPCYVPQLDALLRKKRDAAIRREFNGRNYRQLARKYGLTEVWIRAIIDRKDTPGQPSLF